MVIQYNKEQVRECVVLVGKDHYSNIGKSVSQSHRWVKIITIILGSQCLKVTGG